MTNQIQVFNDGEGALIAGDPSAVEKFLDQAGLLNEAKVLDLSPLTGLAKRVGDSATTVAGIIEQSGMYLKLTPESAKQLKEAGGLMKTKEKGVSWAMLGEPGSKSLKWLEVQDGPAALLTNPAVISGVGGLMTQFAQQSEAEQLRELLVRIDEKLDDVRRSQRDSVLAKMKSSAAAIEEATTIRAEGGDPKTLWDKVSGTSESILNVQEEALHALAALVEKVEDKRKIKDLKHAMHEIEREIAVQLAILARCFELQDRFSVVELDHVLATAPEHLEGHRRGVAAAREKRGSAVLQATSGLMERIDAAGGVATENILLHARAAAAVVDSINETAASIESFYLPLGIELERSQLDMMPWRDALKDPQQLKTAGKEAGQKTAAGAGVIAGAGLFVYGLINKKPSGS